MGLESFCLLPSFHLASSEIVGAAVLSFPLGDRFLTHLHQSGSAKWGCIDPIWEGSIWGSTDGALGKATFPSFCLGGSLIKWSLGKDKRYWLNPIFWWKRLIFFFLKRKLNFFWKKQEQEVYFLSRETFGSSVSIFSGKEGRAWNIVG